MKVEAVAITRPLEGGEFSGASPEQMMVAVARVSSPKSVEEKLQNPAKLIRYCMGHGHWSIFDQVCITFKVETSVAIATQMLRHWSLHPQQTSRRFSNENIGFEDIELRMQGKTNRQVSENEIFKDESLQTIMGLHEINSKELYDTLIANGVANECARFILPQNLSTNLYFNGTLRNWLAFLNRRLEKHAQKEIRMLAVSIAHSLKHYFPETAKACYDFNDFTGNFMDNGSVEELMEYIIRIEKSLMHDRVPDFREKLISDINEIKEKYPWFFRNEE